MSGGGNKHRAPIEIDKNVEASLRFDRDNRQPISSEVVPSAAPAQSMRATVIHHLVTVLLICGMLAIGTWGYLTFKDAPLLTDAGVAFRAPLFDRPAGDAQLERLRFALDVYFKLNSKYPPDLDTLVEDGLLASTDLNYPPGDSTITYERVGESYQLAMERTIVTTTVEEVPAAASPEAREDGAEDAE